MYAFDFVSFSLQNLWLFGVTSIRVEKHMVVVPFPSVFCIENGYV